MNPTNADSAAAGIPEERLSDVLTLIHRDGFGHNAQVVRPDRGRLSDRLRRAGLDVDAIARLAALDRPVVLVFAPARVDAAETILRRGGAIAVEHYRQSAGTQSSLIGFDPAVLHRRRGQRSSDRSPSS